MPAPDRSLSKKEHLFYIFLEFLEQMVALVFSR